MASITNAFCHSAKVEFLKGVHQEGHTYKIALIKTGYAGTYDANITSYTQLGADEVANGNGYTTGGGELTGQTFDLTAGVASMDFSDFVWTGSTISADGAMVYNDSVVGKPALGVFTFGDTIASTNGNFLVQIPQAGAGIFRIS